MLQSSDYAARFIKFIEFDSGGVIYVHYLLDVSNTEFIENYQVAYIKAKAGSRVEILPVLSEKDPERTVIYFDAKLNKNPDLRIDGLLYEVEHPVNPEKLNALKNRIKEGARQADHLIIILNKPIGENLMRRSCKGKFIDFNNLQSVEFLLKDSSIIFYRSDFHYNQKEPLL